MKADWRARSSRVRGVQGYKPNKADWLDGRWSGLKAVKEDGDDPRRGETGVEMETLKEIGEAITGSRGLQGPPHHPALPRQPPQMIETGEGIDWATAEALAFGTLLTRGIRCAFPARIASAAPSRSAIPC
jgi:2-oxoglutarate dehydrogenase E1 component